MARCGFIGREEMLCRLNTQRHRRWAIVSQAKRHQREEKAGSLEVQDGELTAHACDSEVAQEGTPRRLAKVPGRWHGEVGQ
jgi:hypothetical protein